MIIIIVNFNRPDFLEVQIPLILKNLQPDGIHVVNTGQRDNGCKIVAEKYDCKYTYMQLGTSDFSKSHASGLNVAYNLNKQDHEIIGILDHDCFPIAPIDIRAQMEGKYFFASDQERLGMLYPNPACLFIRTSVGCIDFMPCKGMDTGGQLHNLYSQVRQMAYERMEDYEVFAGAFLHIVKGSNWIGGKSNAERVERVFNYVRTFVP
jgi:glycosyltransferase involved in cell wall biosynthesis